MHSTHPQNSHYRSNAPLIVLFLGLCLLCKVHEVRAEVGSDCSFNGIPLHGKVQVVDAFADIKVERVTAFEDIAVERVTAFPDDCGQWEFVDAFPDFTIEYVDSFPDIKVRFVKSFPGLP